MTILKGPLRRRWTCDVCGKTEYWDENWSRYSSISHDETCPNDVPCMCSETCRKIGDEKLKNGEWVLPVLRADPGGFRVNHPRRGY
jgi:hypothetical protein